MCLTLSREASESTSKQNYLKFIKVIWWLEFLWSAIEKKADFSNCTLMIWGDNMRLKKKKDFSKDYI